VTDTIFALATGRGAAGLAVIRVSGPKAFFILQSLAGDGVDARRATLRLLRSQGTVIDEAVCLWFPGPASFTGEDCVEFQCHGAQSVLALMLKTLAGFDGCRLAEPGEFSRRAFENGRMDLAAIEGLGDLIDSETEYQRQQAVRQMMGGLSREIDQWRSDLIAVLALFEADLDFSDEGDIDGRVLDLAEARLKAVRDRMVVALASSGRGERLREGLTVVLAGPPNSGKSTLLNALARRDVAIVSSIAGTTRDIVEARLDLSGYPVTILDTAGMRETLDPIENEGIRRMLARAEAADLVLWLSSALEVETPPPVSIRQLGDRVVTVLTHRDQADVSQKGLAISAISGIGMDDLIRFLTDRAAHTLATGEEGVVLTRARHQDAVVEAEAAINRALVVLHSTGTELVVEEVRLAMRAIGRITGHVGVEDVLDQLFSHFCIGK